MSLWGKIAGAMAGYAVGGVVGGVAGAVAGHFIIDATNDDEVRFTIALIALAAKMTRADGDVSPREIQAVQAMLRVPESEQANMARVFRLAQEDVAGFEAYAAQVKQIYKESPQVLEDVLDVLFYIAYADGYLHPAEEAYLQRVAEIFGIGAAGFARIGARYGEGEMKDPYLVLGVAPTASDGALRRAYVDAVRDNHPDSLQARGMPSEMMHLATERMASINTAWDLVRRERGIK